MTLLTYQLTFQFSRSVTWVNDLQTPQALEIVVIPLSNPSFPDQGTYVGGLQSQTITLGDSSNTAVFHLVPTHSSGLSEPVQYRAEWREGGVTGRTFSYDFAMPAQDCTFDQLVNLDQLITGDVYVQQSQIGVPSGIAALDSSGRVIDSSGNLVASYVDLNTVTDQVNTEASNRATAVAALNTALTASLNTDIANLAATVATNLANALTGVNATITTNADLATAALGTETTARIAADTSLATTLGNLGVTVASHTATLATKADLSGGYLSLAQVPPQIILREFPAANQSAMLALSAVYGNLAIRPDAVFLLLGTGDPTQLSNWYNLSRVSSVNGYQGIVTLTAADVGAVATGGSITQSQVTGLATALSGKASTTDLATLNSTVSGILSNTNIVYLDTSGPSNGYINHAKLDSKVAYINSLNEVTLKDGTVVASGTGTVYSVNGYTTSNVTLTASDVGAIALGASITESQVTGLVSDLAGKLSTSDASVTNARTPTAHASTHASAGSDPVTIAQSQVTGLTSALGALASSATVATQASQISTLQSNVTYLLGGGSPSSSPIKADWWDGTGTFTGVTNPAAFQTTYAVQQKSPFGYNSTDKFYYNPAGANANEWVYPYITPNGHLQLRTWNESNPADPVYALQSDLTTTNTTVGTLATQASLSALTTTVNAKANQSDLNATNATVATLATIASVNALATSVGNCVTQASFNTLQTQVNGNATAASVSSLSTTVASKASQSDMTAAQANITALQAGQATKADLVGGLVPLNELPSLPESKITNLVSDLAAKADLVTGTVPVGQIPSIPESRVTNLTSDLALKADLVGGLVPIAQLPSLSVNQVYTATSQAAMLALSANRGDICVITTGGSAGTYILGTTPASVFANWILMPAPGNAVTSVNGLVGAVNITAAGINAIPAGTGLPISQITNLQTTLNGLATTSALTTAVTGLQSLSQVQGLLTASGTEKQQANYVATSAVSSLSGQQSVDGVLTPLGTTVLCTAQPSSVNNGLWVVNSGAWTRTSDYTTGSYFVRGTMVTVSSGSTNANTFWQETSTSGLVDTSASNWTKVMTAGAPNAYTAATNGGLSLSGTAFSINPVSGGGLAVTSSGASVDTAVVVRKYAGYVPSGSTVATITHGLNTLDVGSVFIREVASGNQVLACPTITGPNTLTIEFASAPSTNQWRVIVHA